MYHKASEFAVHICGVTSSLAIHIPWRLEYQIHIPASASSDATDVNGTPDNLICRRPSFLYGDKFYILGLI